MRERVLHILPPDVAPADAYYAAASHQDLIALGARFRRLPAMKPERRPEFLAEYHALADAQIRANSDSPLIWYTALATKNVWHSCLYIGLEHLWRLRHLLDQSEAAVSLVVPTDALRRLVIEMARKSGWTIRSRSERRSLTSHLKQRLRGPVSAFRYMLALCNYGRSQRNLAEHVSADLVVVSVFLPEKAKGEKYRDIFFGLLLERLREEGHMPVLFGQISGEAEPFSSLLLRQTDYPVRSLVHVVGPRDAARAVLTAARAPLRTAAGQSALGIDPTPLVELDLRQGRWQDITVGSLLELAVERLLTAHPDANILHIYENNRWEYACRRAADRCKRAATGYQHSAVIPSHLKMAAISSVRKPFPDQVITTGPAAREILIDLMRHDPATTIAGCTLRVTPLPAPGTYRRSGRLQNVLILLQGLAILPHFYNALEDAFGDAGDALRVTLRPHPGFTVQQMIRNTRLQLRAPFVVSTEADLLQDLLQHDVVVYGGSTAAMEAVGLGVPAVHFDMGDPVSVDPLFAESALSDWVEDPKQLIAVCRRLAEMPDDDYAEQAGRARLHAEAYFAAPTQAALSSMISIALRKPDHLRRSHDPD